jgi:hypothetical protein
LNIREFCDVKLTLHRGKRVRVKVSRKSVCVATLRELYLFSYFSTGFKFLVEKLVHHYKNIKKTGESFGRFILLYNPSQI